MMCIKKYVIFIFFIIFFQGCGEDNNISFHYYPIIDNQLVKYQGGEQLEYNFYSKESDELNQTEDILIGKEIVNIYTSCLIHAISQRVFYQTTQFKSKENTTILDCYYYDKEGNLTRFRTGDSSVDEIVIPSILNVGTEWYYDDLPLVIDNKKYKGLKEYIIDDQELIIVPFGQVETFKIMYSGFYIQEDDEDAVIINGTIWVHPRIGIVKTKEETYFIPNGKHRTFINTLVKINWEI